MVWKKLAVFRKEKKKGCRPNNFSNAEQIVGRAVRVQSLMQYALAACELVSPSYQLNSETNAFPGAANP